jgi:hypothetical protein
MFIRRVWVELGPGLYCDAVSGDRTDNPGEIAMNRLTCALVGLIATASLVWAHQPKLEADKERQAVFQARSLETAAEVYYSHPQSKNKYPEKLTDLLAPPFGGASFLRNGPADLVDPWGKTFQYATRKDAQGNERPYVWTERTVNGKTRVIGNKPPPRKE